MQSRRRPESNKSGFRPRLKRGKAWLPLIITALAALSCNFPLLRRTPAPVIPKPTETPALTQKPVATLTPTQDPTETATLPIAAIPEGQIVFVCYIDDFDQICLMDSDGEDPRQLTDIQATNFYPSFSPDNSQIVFSSRRDGNFEIYEMSLTGAELQQLTHDIGSLYAPEISPDGTSIVFTNDTGGQQHIWLMERTGDNPRPLTQGDSDNLDPTWSPDGALIAFASNRAGSTQLFTMRPDGSEVRQITYDVELIGGRNAWSPDGRSLVFYAGSRPESDRNLYQVDLNSSSVRQLTDGGDNLAPSFSPDSQWLAFTSYRSGNNDIWILQMDGSRTVQLTHNPRADWQPRWSR